LLERTVNLSGMRVIVVGAGVGGLCVARSLTLRGADVAVFERTSSQERSQVGGMISVWWNATKALAELQLAERVVQAGTVMSQIAFATDRGRHIVNWNLTPLHHELGTPSLGISRTDLYRAIVGQMPEGFVHYNCEYRSFEQDGKSVCVRFADGRVERGDLLIAADGLRSNVRRELVGAESPRYAGYSVWQAVLPQSDWPRDGVFVIRWGAGARFGWMMLKSGLHWAAFLNDQESSAPAGPGTGAMLKERCRDFVAPAAELIAATPETTIFRRDVFDRKPVTTWGRGRVTLLGDAAHPMTQDVGQGACQAMEDSVVLARSLAAAQSIESGLREYERVRTRRTAAIIRTSRTWADVALWSNPIACSVRNKLLWLGLTGLGRRMKVRQILSGI
jgi:2-polyprenyl-6-methoxyphenol hydroxylase-like FAD-dependent oxidoreductase